jgi:hypothetical protein
MENKSTSRAGYSFSDYGQIAPMSEGSPKNVSF